MASSNLNVLDVQSALEASQIALPESPQSIAFAGAPTGVRWLIGIAATPAASHTPRRWTTRPVSSHHRTSIIPPNITRGEASVSGVSAQVTTAPTEASAFTFLGTPDLYPHVPSQAFTFADAAVVEISSSRNMGLPTDRHPQALVTDTQAADTAAQVPLPESPLSSPSTGASQLGGLQPHGHLSNDVMYTETRDQRVSENGAMSLAAPDISFSFADTSKTKSFGPRIVKQRPIEEGADCSICWEPLVRNKPYCFTYCRSSCGQSFHMGVSKSMWWLRSPLGLTKDSNFGRSMRCP